MPVYILSSNHRNAFQHLTDDCVSPLCGDGDDETVWSCQQVASIVNKDIICPTCLKVSANANLNTALYIFRVEGSDLYKIGISSDPDKRLESVRRTCLQPVNMVYRSRVCTAPGARAIERELHNTFADRRFLHKYQREWFTLSGLDVEWAQNRMNAGAIADRRRTAMYVRQVKGGIRLA